MYRILLVDDDKEVLELNKKYFIKKECKVQTCENPVQAAALVTSFQPECILLDVMMPNMDGYQLCRQLRKLTDVPILFLSGKVSEEDKIKGFQCGGDDYIEKPYSIREVYARIVGNISRNRQLSKKNKINSLEISPLTMDIENHKVFFGEEEIPLSNKEYDLLLFLARNPNKELTFEEIGNAIWNSYREEDRRSVMVNMSRLRKKITSYTMRDNLIETIWSKGYKLVVR